MKVEYDGHKYTVEFRHDRVNVMDTAVTRERTTCFIRDSSSESPGDGTHPVIAEGVAVRYYKDPPNRELARKAALAKALDDLFPPMIPRGPHRFSGHENRAHRREFWEMYLNRRARAEERKGAGL